MVKVNSINDLNKSDKIKIIDVKLNFKNIFKVSKKNNANFLEKP